MTKVPQTIDDGLHGWLAGVLDTHGTLAESHTTVIGAGEGFVGQLGRVNLGWEDARPDAPTSVVVKLPTADPGGRAVGQMMGLYERESRFYAELADTVNGDFRLDNMFFGSDGSFALIDWQMAMRVPGSSDLVYFLVTNLSPEMRQQHQWTLIDHYLDTLRAEGVGDDLLSRDAVVRGYREGALLFGVMFVSTMTMERANPRGEAFFDALVGRTVAAIDDLDSSGLVGI